MSDCSRHVCRRASYMGIPRTAPMVRNCPSETRIASDQDKTLGGGDHVGTSRRVRFCVWVSGLLLFFGCRSGAWADPPAGTAPATPVNSSPAEAPKSLPQDGFFSSLKQALKQGYDNEVVRGHFDIGSPPTVRRYYCLVDTKTGNREPNGVLGDLVPLPGGMTGIKNSSVSLYTCADAERQGMLVTHEYNVGGAAAAPPMQTPAQTNTAPLANPAQAANPAPVAVPVQSPISAQASIPAAVPQPIAPPQPVDIAGLRLGMSPDEVRAVLKSKKLLDYDESAETLSYVDPARGVMQPVANGRFVNLIAAWTPPPSGGDSFQVDGESYQVMFTPVPGKERAMGIIHSVGYSAANAVHETALESGLIKKYGGFAPSGDLPESPTWRFQSDGSVQVGDSCNGRGTLGGLAGLNVSNMTRENLALKGTPEQFKSQMERCGIAIVTEDHFTANGGAMREDRLVTRFTVTAYSPSMGFEDARVAAQLIHAAGGSLKKSNVARGKDLPASSL